MSMPNGFQVDPAAVAGYGVLCAATAADCLAIGQFVEDNTTSDEGFDALVMGELRGPVNEYATTTAQRLRTWYGLLTGTATELNRSARVYTGSDAVAEARFESGHPTAPIVTYRDYPDPYRYPHDDVTGIIAKPSDESDGGIAEVMDNADLTLAAEVSETVLDSVQWVLGQADIDFDWREKTLGRLIGGELTGDWNSLKRKGFNLDMAGGAAEVAANNLSGDGQLAALMQEWQGGAADSFRDYITRLAGALRYEAALNEIVGKAYCLAAELIKETAEVVVELLGKVVQKIVEYATRLKLVEALGSFAKGMAESMWDQMKAVPLGLAGHPAPAPSDPMEDLKNQIREEWEFVKQFYEDAMAVANTITALPGLLEDLIDAAQDPIGAIERELTERINTKLEPITEQGERILGDSGGDGIEIVNQIEEVEDSVEDLGTIADTAALADAPDDSFALGRGPRRPGTTMR